MRLPPPPILLLILVVVGVLIGAFANLPGLVSWPLNLFGLAPMVGGIHHCTNPAPDFPLVCELWVHTSRRARPRRAIQRSVSRIQKDCAEMVTAYQARWKGRTLLTKLPND